MILECPSCRARYVVPIGLFAQGGRQVRCARCKHDWHAKLPTTIDVFALAPPPTPLDQTLPPIVSSAAAPVQTATSGIYPSSVSVPDAASTIAALIESFRASSSASAPATAFAAPSALGDAPSSAQLPAVIKNWNKARIRKYILRAFIVLLVLVLLLLWPVFDRDKIVKARPELRGTYEGLGLSISHTGAGLTFDHVTSELKYDAGIMRLHVDGIIHNSTPETQFLPDIRARALGPDRAIIQSWWVTAPAPTLAAGGDAPFHTEVNAPTDHTIEDVYLEFYAQDEKGDVVQ